MIEFVNKYLFGITSPVLLITAGLFFTVYLGGFHLRYPSIVFGVLGKKRNGDGTSAFKALTLALAGTLGVGNIVGVSAAICAGGFGAVFWMCVSALCAMILKYAEVVLAMRHRRYGKNGEVSGSAMYYIEDHFSKKAMPRIGKTVALIFAVFCVANAVSMGAMIQANAVSESLDGAFGISPALCGGVLSIGVLFIILKGRDKVSRITELLVPLMSVGYIVMSLAVLIIRRDALMEAVHSILTEAFRPNAAFGGILGYLLSNSIRYGTMRGLISNEAGCGTAPMAHCGATGTTPAEQGIWGIFEVFIDTVVLCTMTALVVIINFNEADASRGWLSMTVNAYAATLGPIASVFLSIAVLCFGFATLLCWGEYAIEAMSYIKRGEWAKKLCIYGYCAAIFFGTVTRAEWVWAIADFAIGGMTLINVSMIYAMRREVKEETRDCIEVSKKEKTKK